MNMHIWQLIRNIMLNSWGIVPSNVVAFLKLSLTNKGILEIKISDCFTRTTMTLYFHTEDSLMGIICAWFMFVVSGGFQSDKSHRIWNQILDFSATYQLWDTEHVTKSI